MSVAELWLSPPPLSNLRYSLLRGQRGSANHALARFANVPKLGRKKLLPIAPLARYQSKKLNRSVELGPRNTRRVDTFGKITKRSCQRVTLKQEGFCKQSAPNYLCFTGSKNADLSLGNHAEGLGKMRLPVFLFTAQRAAGSFCF